MIQAVGLTSIPRKAHPPVVDDVSFEACAGRVTALLGPAGAGKTTALRLMLELQQGRGITYFRGRPLHRIPHPAREVGVLLGDVPGHPARSVRGHLRMLCAAAGVPVRRADEVLEVVGLVSLREERLGTLSRGMDRRLGLACALLPDPHTLVLDDPTGGLSTREARWMHGMLRAHAAQGGTVLYTTADSKEAARAADRVVTLDGGRLVADQEAGEFARNRLRPRVAVRSPHAARLAVLLGKEARTAQRSVEVVREDGNRLSVYGSTTADIGETAFRHGILIHQLADEVGDMGAGAGAESRDVAAVAGEPATAVRERHVPERSSEGRTRAVLGSSAEGRPAGRAQAVSELLPGNQNPMAEAQAQSASDSAQASTSTSPSASTSTSVPGEAEAEPTSAAVPDGAAGDASVGAAGASPTGDSRPAGTIPQTVPAEVSGGQAAAGGTAATGTHASGATVPGARNPSTRDPGSGRTRTGRPVPARAGAADAPEVLSTLPPPISPRPAPSPLRPLRYELRRAAGIGTGFLTCGAALVVSALTAVILARFGHTPQERLFAAWPRELPLPPAALAAGLLGALAFGDEFRHPALAADRGTVPRRLGLLTAKLVVSGATALLLAFLTLGCDAEVLYLVYGRELTQVPTDWLSLTASWFGLVTGCAWAGVLAAGVFRSATAGLAAVLAVPVLVVPAVHLTLGGSTVRTAAGLPARMRELLLLQWPFGGDRYLLATARVVAQPVGGALTLSLTALLCAYLAGTLRARAR
ncbi:ATP-binding cassette domain-containing protein [Streptomyces collinus]|uniref:ATP-binding cassette domain-containing protein n=1 Tax=Streptomyces collinus TaxID=42684 RepID=UPI003691D969